MTRTSNFGDERVEEHYQITKERNSKCDLIFAEVFGVEEIIVITKLYLIII